MGNKNITSFTIATPGRPDPFTVNLSGRTAWALEQLIAAGKKGVTPINNPAPRWSAYVHNLRAEGVRVETIHEPHGGAFPGTHGRYVLRCAAWRENGQKGASL